MEQNGGYGEKREMEEIYDKCFLCGEWWWRSAMKIVRIADMEGYVPKHVCGKCFHDVNERSCLSR